MIHLSCVAWTEGKTAWSQTRLNRAEAEADFWTAGLHATSVTPYCGREGGGNFHPSLAIVWDSTCWSIGD